MDNAATFLASQTSSGTVGIGSQIAIDVTLTSPRAFLIINDGAGALEFSFDNSNFFSLNSGESIEIECGFKKVWLRTGATAATYRVLIMGS